MKAKVSKITYYSGADALYIYLSPSPHVASTRNFTQDIILDLDDKGDLLGIEVLDVSETLNPAALVKQFDLDPGVEDILNHVKSLIPSVKEELVLA